VERGRDAPRRRGTRRTQRAARTAAVTCARAVPDHHRAGVASLRAHRTYLDGLGRDFDPEGFLRGFTARAGAALGVPHAVGGRIQLQGV
jgi:hypothetical protein